MLRSIRGYVGLAFLAAATLFAVGGTCRTAFAEQEDPKSEKKLEMPKLPEGSNPKWDFETIEEKYTVIKGNINEGGHVYFLLELKEDIAATAKYLVVFTNSEGVKFFNATAECDPMSGKKGDRVRLTFIGASPTTQKEKWIKAVKVQIVPR